MIKEKEIAGIGVAVIPTPKALRQRRTDSTQASVVHVGQESLQNVQISTVCNVLESALENFYAKHPESRTEVSNAWSASTNEIRIVSSVSSSSVPTPTGGS